MVEAALLPIQSNLSKGGDRMLMPVDKTPVDKTPVERAEELLPQIGSIFCGTLSGKEARRVMHKGRAVLRELEKKAAGSAVTDPYLSKLIGVLKDYIKEAKQELKRCEE